MPIRELRADEVEFVVECCHEELPIRGNCSAIDDETDEAAAESIFEQLAAGNEWAWCCVRVTAKWRGWTASETLGGCSYTSEAQFREPGGYFDDVKDETLSALNAELQEADADLEELRELVV